MGGRGSKECFLTQGLLTADQRSGASSTMSSRLVSLFANGFKFPEGPAFDRNGNLFIVDVGTGDISTISPEGRVKTFVNTGGAPNGAKFHPNGDLYVADRVKGIIAISPDGKVRVIVDRFQGKKFNGPNDLVFDSRGNLYFTDPHGSSAENPFGRCLSTLVRRGNDLPGLGIGLSQRGGVRPR